MNELGIKQFNAVKTAVSQLETAAEHATIFYTKLTAVLGYRDVAQYWGVKCEMLPDNGGAIIKTPYGDVRAASSKVIEGERPQIRFAFKMEQDAELNALELSPYVWAVYIDSSGAVTAQGEVAVELGNLNEQTVTNNMQELAISLIYAIGSRPRKIV